VLIRCSEMRVDTPNPLWAWCVFSMQPRRQSMLIAPSFRPACDICATIISLIFSDARHLPLGSYGFQLQSPTCTFMIPKPHFIGKISTFGLCVPGSSPNHSMMCPMNVTIVRVAGAATMAISPIQIIRNSFTLIPSESMCLVMSGPA